jgi:rhodanese-related sulfurtransferase
MVSSEGKVDGRPGWPLNWDIRTFSFSMKGCRCGMKRLMETKPGTFTLVDVRDPQEFAEGHIPGAINIPSQTFAAGSAALDKEKLIVVYCKSGGRSYTAYRKLQKLDYSKIAQAIFADWAEAGLPIT